MRGQRRDAGGVCPPVLLGPWRTRRHLEPRRRPCGLLAATALMYLDAAITRRAAQGQLIQHSVRGALQLIRLPHGGNGSGELRKRRLADRESDAACFGARSLAIPCNAREVHAAIDRRTRAIRAFASSSRMPIES